MIESGKMSYCSKQRVQKALAEGKCLAYSHSNILQLDIDSVEDYQRYKTLIPVLDKLVDIAEILQIPSPGGKGHHIYIRLVNANLTIAERIAIQSILGSDPMRELLSMFKNQNERGIPILLFEKDTMVKKYAEDETYQSKPFLAQVRDLSTKTFDDVEETRGFEHLPSQVIMPSCYYVRKLFGYWHVFRPIYSPSDFEFDLQILITTDSWEDCIRYTNRGK